MKGLWQSGWTMLATLPGSQTEKAYTAHHGIQPKKNTFASPSCPWLILFAMGPAPPRATCFFTVLYRKTARGHSLRSSNAHHRVS